METIVVKFGGSSLASAAQIQKAAAIVGENPARRFVVVSAPGKRSKDDEKVTDLLYRCGTLAASGEDFSPVLEKITRRFAEIIDGLGIENFDLAAEMDAIRAHLAAPQEAYLASRGEYLNAKIIAAYLGRPFVETAEASHVSGTAVITLSGTPDAQAVKAAVEAEDYVFLGMDA